MLHANCDKVAIVKGKPRLHGILHRYKYIINLLSTFPSSFLKYIYIYTVCVLYAENIVIQIV